MTRQPLATHPQEIHWPAALASLTVGALFFALWFWLLPPVLGFAIRTAGPASWRWLAAIPSILGFAIALRCMWDFGATGRGTPAPMLPPSKLVITGFYRYVRNPMYFGFFLGWLGLWIVFGQASINAVLIVSTAFVAVLLFVVIYEEPHLRKTFGQDYIIYCQNVPRWLPRLHPWQQ
jgi:protein-S-isoprenylcysteine O-methyltransferase Ste14